MSYQVQSSCSSDIDALYILPEDVNVRHEICLNLHEDLDIGLYFVSHQHIFEGSGDGGQL